MENSIAVGVLVVIIAGIIFYLVKQKKNGVKCAGCPHSKQCGGTCCGDCSHTENHQK